jgi:hypothetical protein
MGNNTEIYMRGSCKGVEWIYLGKADVYKYYKQGKGSQVIKQGNIQVKHN